MCWLLWQKSCNNQVINVFCKVLISQHQSTVMKGGANIMAEAIKALDNNNNNKQVIVNIVINGASIFDVNHKGGETCEEEWGAQRVLQVL